jgi:hypothetical protein
MKEEKKNFTVFIWESAFVSPIARRCSISSRAVLKRDKNNHYKNESLKSNRYKNESLKSNPYKNESQERRLL